MKIYLFLILVLANAPFDVSAQKHAPRPYSANKFVPGIYPEASKRLLKYMDVRGLTDWDLKVMRNEIYARHGYIFKTQEMIDYFNSQTWYYPSLRNVDHKLSEVEKKNITFIKSYE